MGGIAQRLEARVRLLDPDGEVADLLDLPLVVAHVVAALELVGEEVVARIVVVGQREISFEEAWRGGGLVFGACEAAVRPHLGELVLRVGLREILLQDVAADEVVVIGERIPLGEVAGEEVGDPHALAPERLGPWRPIGGAEDRVRAAGTPDQVVDQHRELLAVRADAVVLGVRSLHLREAEGEVSPQVVLLRLREGRRLEPVRGPREREHSHCDSRREPRPDRPCEIRRFHHGEPPLAHSDAEENPHHA